MEIQMTVSGTIMHQLQETRCIQQVSTNTMIFTHGTDSMFIL